MFYECSSYYSYSWSFIIRQISLARQIYDADTETVADFTESCDVSMFIARISEHIDDDSE